jgi:hypothetical protein
VAPYPVAAPYPMAASVAVAELVAGPRRRVEVAAVTPQAVYLATRHPELPALCLAAPAAVRVPCAVVLAAAPPALTGPGWVGDGEVRVGDFAARVTRWWRPPRPRSVAALPRVRPKLDPGTEPLVTDLVAALALHGPLTAHVTRLLGRGPGLTPLGDDVLAGVLVTLGALRLPAFARLGAVVRAHAPARTTVVSTALLYHAARGECLPELAAVLAGEPAEPLLRVGGSSGTGLLRGVTAALTAAPLGAPP